MIKRNSSLSDITNYKGRFVLNSEDSKWNKVVYSNKKKVCINAPIYVKADNQVSGTKNGLSGNEVSISRAKTLIKESKITTLNHEIIIDGEISGFTLEGGNNSLDGKAASITIKGKSSTYGTDKIKGGGTAADENVALIIKTSVPVTLQNITVTGGNNSYTYSSSNTMGGGIIVGSSADVTLSDGVLITGNYAYKFGGAIYQAGNLYLKDIVKFSGEISKQNNDIYVCTNKTIKITDLFPTVGGSVVKITAGNHNKGTVLVEKGGNLDSDNFKNSLIYLEMTTADSIVVDDENTPTKGKLAFGVYVNSDSFLSDAVARLSQDGDTIVYDTTYLNSNNLGINGSNALNGSTYKYHMDLTKATSASGFYVSGLDKLQKLSINASCLVSGEEIKNCSNLETLCIYGSFSSTNKPNGFGQTNLITSCASLQNIEFLDATSVFLMNGLLNIWKNSTEGKIPRQINNQVINIYLPVTVTTIEIQDRFQEIGQTFDGFEYVKILYGGTAQQLSNVTIKRAHTNSNITTWNQVNGGVKIYYNDGNGNYTNYKTWTPADNSPNGTLQ